MDTINEINEIVRKMHPDVAATAYALCVRRMSARCTEDDRRACDGLMNPHAPHNAPHVDLGTINTWMSALYSRLTTAQQDADAASAIKGMQDVLDEAGL